LIKTTPHYESAFFCSRAGSTSGLSKQEKGHFRKRLVAEYWQIFVLMINSGSQTKDIINARFHAVLTQKKVQIALLSTLAIASFE
jgi:hypothetical protein